MGISDEITGISLDQLQPFMKPWTWPQIMQVKVRVRDGAGGRTTTETVEAVRWKGELIDCGHCRDEQTAVRSALDEEYDRSKAVGFNAFKWQPTGALSKLSAIRDKPWHTFVGQLSTNPAPFPHCLNLSFIFYIDKLTTAGQKSVFAAPLLPKTSSCAELSLPWDHSLAPKGDAPPEWPDHAGIFQWEYENDTGGPPTPPLIAHMAECRVRLAGATVATFLDLDTQWVGNLPDNADLFGEDWRPMVEERMADALDIPQRIIEYLRTKLDDQTILPKLKLFQWAAIASLRDLVGPGIYPGPDNRRFVDFAFRTVDDQYAGIGAHLGSIETRVNEKFGTLTDWLTFLKLNLPEVSNLSVLSLPRLFDDNGPKLQKVVPEEQATVKSIVAELEQLHKVVLDPKNLVVLLRQQWRELFTGILSAPEMALMEKVNLDALNVRHYLALENLGDLWNVFIRMPSDGGSGHDIIRRNFSCLFQEYFCKRFELSLVGLTADVEGSPVPCDITSIQTGYRNRQPDKVINNGTVFKFELDDQIRLAIVNQIRNWSKDFVEALLPRNIESTTVPHAITMQVDGLAARPGDSVNPEQQDILRRIAGVGVLMRQEGQAWRCLNFAAAYNKEGSSLISDPVLVSSRLNYRNDLRQAFLSYNNQPLTAESPLTETAMTPVRAQFQTRLSQEDELKRNPLPYLRLKYSNDAVARRLPALEFGKKFEILPFMVANCGALPTALLATDTTRRSLIEASINDFSTTRLSEEDLRKVRTIEYRRKVRIGGIRAFDENRRVSLKLPPIPDTVLPRARDIHKSEFDRIELFPSVVNPDPAQYPLLLLAPQAWAQQNNDATYEFPFWIRKPATDVNTWDRWIASSLGRDRRVSVWADFYRQSEEKRKSTTPAQGTARFEQADTSIDDPATTNYFYFELSLIDGSSTTPLKTQWVNVLPSTATEKLKSVQSQPTKVVCKIDTTEAIVPSRIRIGNEDFTLVNITVKKGQVYQLNIFSCVAKADYDSRFAGVIPAKRKITDPNSTDVYLVSPFTMLVETATEVLIEDIEGDSALKRTDQRLWERLQPAFGPANHPGSIAFTVAPTDVVADEGFKFLHRAELMRQVWRWQGRETPLHPALNENSACRQGGAVISNLDTCVEVDQWEAWEFGNRFETDHLIQDMTTLPPTRLGGRKFFYKEVLETGNGDSDELRALHYRFAITVHSRYAGIMPPNVPSKVFENVAPARTSRTQIQLSRNETRDTMWRRLFVPCRRKKELPVPKVKFILPLTESFGEEPGNTAGLLVVLNEPWYQEAGLGEGLAAEVQMTPAPENPLNTPGDKDTYYFELGTDPLVQLATRGFRQSRDPENAFFDEMCLNQKIRGPVGHTFDRTNESPLFATTSFIIPAPSIFSTPKGQSRDRRAHDFGWDFCRLRLRRVVTLSKKATTRTDCRLTKPDDLVNCDAANAASQLVGPFTEPFWVQYLPEFSHFAPADNKLSDARLKLEDDNPLQLSIIDRHGQRMLLSPTASLNGIFELYLVLTRRVFDVAGRPEQEVYLEVFHQDADAKWTTSIPPSLTSDAGLRARVIEVQRRPPDTGQRQTFPSGEPLWLALFGPKATGQNQTADKDLARIVRISQPIEGLSTTSVIC